MRNMLAFLAALVIVLGGVGWYLDWFKLTTQPNGEGHQQVTIDVDVKKAGSDVSTAVKKGEEFVEKERSNATNPEAKGVEVKADIKGVEVKTPKIDAILPLKPPGN